jgi:phosphoribosyl-ATP pyrophosphohydrolase
MDVSIIGQQSPPPSHYLDSTLHRGIVHKPQAIPDPESESMSTAASGQLTGLAEDQDVFVHVDEAARNDQSYVNSRSQQQAAVQTGPRILREIVQESTERWMLANDGADDEYYREMSNMGYDKEGETPPSSLETIS